MSSPRLNNVIVVGCIMTYFSVILFGLDGGLISTEQYGKVCIVSNSVIYMSLHHAVENRTNQITRMSLRMSSNLSITQFIVGAFSNILFFSAMALIDTRISGVSYYFENELSHICFPFLLGSCLDHVYWLYSGVWRNVREDVASARNL